MPSGWVIQGGNAYALVLAPQGDKDTNIDSFIGKLVVMLQSQDAHGSRPWRTSQPVAGRPGRFDVQGNTEILTYQDQAEGPGRHPGPDVARLGQRRGWPSSRPACRSCATPSRAGLPPGAARPAGPC